MAVKKKEKSAQSQVMSSSRKDQQDKAKTTNQKMKSADNKEAKKIEGLPFVQQFAEAGRFLGEVRAESRKISWPERSQVIRETVSVLFLVALITFFVWSFDLVVGKFIFAPLEHWGHLYGIGGA